MYTKTLQPLAALSMQHLAVDTLGPLPVDVKGYKYILVIIDEFSRYINLFTTINCDAAAYVDALWAHIAHFGIPAPIRSDGGPQFVVATIDKLHKLLKIKRILSYLGTSFA